MNEQENAVNGKKEITPSDIAEKIMEKAHRGQKRRNGEPYRSHPTRMAERFDDLICPYGYDVDPDKVFDLGIPFFGVLDVCFLHDVIEDTSVDMSLIASIYESCGWDEYFLKCVKEPLSLITHDKKDPYPVYIEKVMSHPVSALVKMLDLEDNLKLFGLNEIDEWDLKRSKNYVEYFDMINGKYHYLEKFTEYRAHMKERAKRQRKEKENAGA